jgi:hypothetical protein
MRKLLIPILLIALMTFNVAFGQVDRTQIALDVSKADEENTEQLKFYIWKRIAITKVKGKVESTKETLYRFDEEGKIQTRVIEEESNVKKKRGIVRGQVQKSSIEKNLEYVEKALALSQKYAFMTKGELIDFFEKAVLTKRDNRIIAAASDVFVKGDILSITFNSDTKLYVRKKFTTVLEEDDIEGDIKYGSFNSGIVHISETILKLPAKEAVIESKNQDYIQLVR